MASRLQAIRARMAQEAGGLAGAAMPRIGGSSLLPRDPGARLAAIRQLMRPEEEEAPTGIARFVHELPEPIKEQVGGALRGIASFLAPLQLPQDVFFGAIAGVIDKDTTIAERLGRLEWGKYLPGGDVPMRPVHGQELFEMMGFDEKTSKWAGIGADLIVDPLIFGSWLRLGSKVTGIKNLAQLGDRVDNFISPIGLGREVGRLARRSPHISNYMDARMEELLRVIRNPESHFLGIERFGEKAMRAAEMVLPRGQQYRLKLGAELGSELHRIEQMGKAAGMRLHNDAVEMLRLAKSGVLGDSAEDYVRGYIRTMEQQMRAFETHLNPNAPGSLPRILLDTIEKTTYDTLQRGRVGWVPLVAARTKGGISSIADPDAKIIAESVMTALEPTIATRGIGGARDFVEELAKQSQRWLDDAIDHVGNVARKHAQQVGMSEQAAMQFERRAIQTFNDYLRDTALIDAKLGLHQSGFEFIGNQVRQRAFELTGKLEDGERVWNRLLAAGLRGPERFNELLDAPTHISLRQLIRGPDAGKNVQRRLDHRNALANEMKRLRGDRPQIRRDTYDRKIDEMLDEATNILDELYGLEPTWSRIQNPRGYGPVKVDTGALRKARQETIDAAREWVDRTRALKDPGRQTLGPFPERSTRWAKRREQKPKIPEEDLGTHLERQWRAEDRLRRALDAESDLMNQLRGGFESAYTQRPVKSLAAFDEVTRSRAMERVDHILKRIGEVDRKLRNSIAGRRLSIDEARAARAAAREATQTGRGPGPLYSRGAMAVDDVGHVPFKGQNTIGEDILARRLHNGEGLEAALRKNVTYAELLDGMHNMQALPLAEYLNGLMRGHLRRAYAVFSDVDDFKNYVDSVRYGRVLMSNFVDEKDLRRTMQGFEREADLILDYHKALSSKGRGLTMRKDNIAKHLLENGVDPHRVRDAMVMLLRSANRDNRNVQRFLDTMDEFLPRYREMVARRDRLDVDPTQPFVAHRRFFEEREQLPQHILEALGEVAQSQFSLLEGAEVARRVVSRQEAFQGMYALGRQRGLIREAPHTDQFGARFVKYAEGDTVMGGFAGKYIHPYLAKELQRLASVPKGGLPPAVNRVRSLITGGYLASPAVIAANTFGGFYQAATVGLNPFVMMRRMIEVFPEVDKHVRGRRSELVRELMRRVDVEASTLTFQDFHKALKGMKLDEYGVSPGGVRRMFDDFTQMYEKFLQKPGIGPLRSRFLGLEGFQFTENWFKVAAYAEMKGRLTSKYQRQLGRQLSPADIRRVEDEAAEFARLVVFDYSELPQSLEILKNWGLVLFPGFTYFLAGRTLNAALNRPGALAVADRITEAMANASLDLEEQVALLLGTPEWLQQEQGAPMPFSVRRDEAGDTRVSVIPMAQLIPTKTLWEGMHANPFAESISSLGVWGPVVEVLGALVSGDGEAVFSGRYGNRVFDAESEGARKAADVTRFLFNSFAPGIVKKSISVDMRGELAGLIPSIPRMFQDLSVSMPDDLAGTIYSFDERRTQRPDRTWREDLISTFLRSPRVVALEGPLAGIRSELTTARSELNTKLSSLRNKANRARSGGDDAAAARYEGEMTVLIEDFNRVWREYMAFHQNFQRSRNLEREPTR
jgi:hypothetical protein